MWEINDKRRKPNNVGIFYHCPYRMGDRGILTNRILNQNAPILIAIGVVEIVTTGFQFCIFCSLTYLCYSHKMNINYIFKSLQVP
jgi:hypothetical protein